MGLKEDEQYLLKLIEDAGFERWVHQDVFTKKMVKCNKQGDKLEQITIPDPTMVVTVEDREVMALGVTTVRIGIGDESPVGRGEAVCALVEKNFHRAKGRIIATGRAVRDAGLIKRKSEIEKGDE